MGNSCISTEYSLDVMKQALRKFKDKVESQMNSLQQVQQGPTKQMKRVQALKKMIRSLERQINNFFQHFQQPRTPDNFIYSINAMQKILDDIGKNHSPSAIQKSQLINQESFSQATDFYGKRIAEDKSKLAEFQKAMKDKTLKEETLNKKIKTLLEEKNTLQKRLKENQTVKSPQFFIYNANEQLKADNQSLKSRLRGAKDQLESLKKQHVSTLRQVNQKLFTKKSLQESSSKLQKHRRSNEITIQMKATQKQIRSNSQKRIVTEQIKEQTIIYTEGNDSECKINQLEDQIVSLKEKNNKLRERICQLELKVKKLQEEKSQMSNREKELRQKSNSVSMSSKSFAEMIDQI